MLWRTLQNCQENIHKQNEQELDQNGIETDQNWTNNGKNGEKMEQK